MSTIPTSDLVAEVRRQAAFALSNSEAIADALRGNRIDWLQAFNAISDHSNHLSHICSAFDAVLRDADDGEARAAVSNIQHAAIDKLDTLQTNLRVSCLLNGPKRRAA